MKSRRSRVGRLLGAVGMATALQGPALGTTDGLPDPIALTPAELEALHRGDPIYRHWKDAEGRERGVSAIVVDASADAVWAHIVDYDAYVDFLPYVTASATRSVQHDGQMTTIISVFELTTMGVVTSYEVENRWDKARSFLSFTMLSERGRVLQSGEGWWRVSSWEGPGVLLEYSIDVDTAWWVPGFLERRAADQGLPILVGLIKRRAER